MDGVRVARRVKRLAVGLVALAIGIALLSAETGSLVTAGGVGSHVPDARVGDRFTSTLDALCFATDRDVEVIAIEAMIEGATIRPLGVTVSRGQAMGGIASYHPTWPPRGTHQLPTRVRGRGTAEPYAHECRWIHEGYEVVAPGRSEVDGLVVTYREGWRTYTARLSVRLAVCSVDRDEPRPPRGTSEERREACPLPL